MSAESHAGVMVIGVGNTALSDEGVASRVVREIARRAPPWVKVVHAGLPGPRLLALLAGREKVVILDAVDAGHPPGTVYRFRPGEAAPAKAARRHSLHQGDVLFQLGLAKALGMGPREVVVIGVQPANLAPGETLSPAVEAAVAKAAQMALAEVRLRDCAALQGIRVPAEPCPQEVSDASRPNAAIQHPCDS